MLFSSIPGLEETKVKLINAIQNDHLAHALLFHGKEGSPSLPLVLAMATYINCANPAADDACGKCPSCVKMGKLVHPDLNFAMPLPAAGKKDDEETTDLLSSWRNFVLKNPYGNLQDWNYHLAINKPLSITKGAAKQIVKTLSLKSFEGGYKMMLIWSPETMHVAAANALLKVLEEPPEKRFSL